MGLGSVLYVAQVSEPASAAVAKHHRLGLTQQTFVPHGPEAGRPRSKRRGAGPLCGLPPRLAGGRLLSVSSRACPSSTSP